MFVSLCPGRLIRGQCKFTTSVLFRPARFRSMFKASFFPVATAVRSRFSFSADLGSLPPGNYTVLYEQSVFDFFIGGYIFNASRSLALTVASIVPTVTPNALVTTALLLLVVGAAHLRWSRRQRRS